MTLTHDEIAKMTCEQVNVAIAKRLNVDAQPLEPFGTMADKVSHSDLTHQTGSTGARDLFINIDYCHDWTHAGRLLEMMGADDICNTPILWHQDKVWCCRQSIGDKTKLLDLVGGYLCKTATEEVSRCWLEWYDATHEATP
jgi:hypothetical protein